MIKVIFFGLGSIGRRHINILRKMSGIDIFAYRSGVNKDVNDLGIEELNNWEEIKAISPEVAFITNPTSLHIETAIKCAKLGMKLFIEKPVGSTNENLDVLIDEVSKRKLVTYVGYNLRFHPVIRRLKEYLQDKKIYHVSICNSSFLPNWRPDKSIEDLPYVSIQKGGGAVLEQSHEMDYIEYLFGPIEKIRGVFDRASDVTIDVEDFLDALVQTLATSINLHIDFFSMRNERSLKISCENEMIYADLVNSRVEFHDKCDFRTEEMDKDRMVSYSEQMKYFMNNIDNANMMNNILEARDLFNKILAFKERGK